MTTRMKRKLAPIILPLALLVGMLAVGAYDIYNPPTWNKILRIDRWNAKSFGDWMPLKWSGTPGTGSVAGDTTWRSADTLKPFDLKSLPYGDTTLIWGISVIDLTTGKTWTATMYHMAVSLQFGNSVGNAWKTALVPLVVDSIGQYGTKQQYHAKFGRSCDSQVVSKSFYAIWKTAAPGCDMVRPIITKDTAECAIARNAVYKFWIMSRAVDLESPEERRR